MRSLVSMGLAGLVACLSAATVRAHELWFQPAAGNAPVVRLTFGDSPAPGEAERVAEIAHAKVWGDGLPLEVRRHPDGLEAVLPARRPAVLSAFADRGVVDYQGDSFVIELAAYAQSRPVDATEPSNLGLDDDQLRLLLVSRGRERPVVRAVWKGKPAADVAVEIFRDPAQKPTEVRTDGRGEVPCPDLKAGPVSLLAVVFDKTAGKRQGRDYTHTRFKATLALGQDATGAALGSPADECLARVSDVHGAAGPWAVAGYRIGERALKELGLPRHSFRLLVVHRSPAEVQYSCVADGLQAATGASPGKLNLKLEEATPDRLSTAVTDRETGRTLTFTLRPEFVRSVLNLPHDRLEDEGRRVAALPDGAIFTVSETKPPGRK
jgi:hypothetical protein